MLKKSDGTKISVNIKPIDSLFNSEYKIVLLKDPLMCSFNTTLNPHLFKKTRISFFPIHETINLSTLFILYLFYYLIRLCIKYG